MSPPLRPITDLLQGNRTHRAESKARSKSSSQRRAGLGVWAATRATADRSRIVDWKRSGASKDGCGPFAASIASLVREWGGVFNAQVFVTVPPQGASAPSPYAAGLIAREVAGLLALPFVATLRRTDQKRWHGPWNSLLQAPYLFDPPPPGLCLAIVVDDLVTSGTTMRLSLEACRASGCMAFGFGYSGV